MDSSRRRRTFRKCAACRPRRPLRYRPRRELDRPEQPEPAEGGGRRHRQQVVGQRHARADGAPGGRGRGHATGVLLVRGRGEDVERLAGGEVAVIGGVGAGDDGLRPQHRRRPLLAGLGPQHTDHVLFQRNLVHHGEAVAAAHDLERRRILAAVQADRAIAAQPERGRAPAVDLDDAADDDGTDDARAPGAGRARAQLDHVDVVAAQLGHARAVHHGHADRVLGRGRRDERHQRDHRHERRALGRPHRRPKSQNSRVSSSDSPMEVASGK